MVIKDILTSLLQFVNKIILLRCCIIMHSYKEMYLGIYMKYIAIILHTWIIVIKSLGSVLKILIDPFHQTLLKR